VNDGDGNVLVSKRKLDSQQNFLQLEQAFEEKTTLPGKITDFVKGGLIANILGCRAFVPKSQISARFTSDEEIESFKGKEFNFNIIEFDRTKRRIVAGRRELAVKEAEEKRNEIFGKIEVGQVIEGTVSRLVDFGAFVDLGGIDGLIHVSEVSWKRIRKPSDVLEIGDKVSATVIQVDPAKGKISLTLKDIKSNPWNGILEKYPIGEIVEGTVARLAQFGAFVTLEDGVDGLVHISQIANRRISKPDEELSPGQKIQVKVLDIDLESHKISLSKREADAILNPPPEEPEEDTSENQIDNDQVQAK
jgi:4-hydroxy-3-methylbut-2-enyl diphosphate reductase